MPHPGTTPKLHFPVNKLQIPYLLEICNNQTELTEPLTGAVKNIWVLYAIVTEAISKTLGDTYQRLYELPDPKLPVKYPRTPGYRPSAAENPYNAW